MALVEFAKRVLGSAKKATIRVGVRLFLSFG